MKQISACPLRDERAVFAKSTSHSITAMFQLPRKPTPRIFSFVALDNDFHAPRGCRQRYRTRPIDIVMSSARDSPTEGPLGSPRSWESREVSTQVDFFVEFAQPAQEADWSIVKEKRRIGPTLASRLVIHAEVVYGTLLHYCELEASGVASVLTRDAVRPAQRRSDSAALRAAPAMLPLRRAHVAALTALSAAVLLLLARYGPAPPHPAVHKLFAPAPPPPALALSSYNNSSSAAVERVSNDTTTVAHHRAAAPPRPQAVNTSTEPHVLLTRDLYVAGHSVPHPELCPGLGARLRLLVLVTSAPAHASAREAIRLTWGHYALRADVAIAFVVGAAPIESEPTLLAEDTLYGDLIRGRFVDSYSNLTLKSVSMLEWVDEYCPRVPRLLKTDDDMFINVPRLLDFVARTANDTRTIWGKVVRRSLPKRAPSSKYYVPPQQYPARVFPDFATGPAYLVSVDVVRPLYEAALREPYLRLEDVFVTGVLAGRLHVRRQHTPEFYNKKVAAHPCAVQRGLAIHMVRYHEQFDLWRKLLDGKTKCAAQTAPKPKAARAPPRPAPAAVTGR
ncbi:Lactosylceramide 1,3-N-acetyl-beta-D-glucosaminyltransferase [Eumeta japonica]|uniref:Lactosylceramide 1,3-N-acetyl-beta-D-glucosaminyltransferase n=1 Tax=Eumeta variegata TaxID=151549 RepID=A0A4C1XWD8_EUMVA|nr:Lactosylceramide 1,3-N-acetyl-beta-D-glucosaminyltransferase [Eumeta japonica]